MPFNFAVRQNHSRLVREQEIHCALKKCWPWVRDLFFAQWYTCVFTQEDYNEL